MKLTLSLVILALPLLSAAVRAEENPRVAYQKALLARVLSPEDKAFCDGQVGPRSEENVAAYDQCHVTRLFVSDLANNKETPGIPPMLKGAYVKKAEVAKVAAKLK